MVILNSRPDISNTLTGTYMILFGVVVWGLCCWCACGTGTLQSACRYTFHALGKCRSTNTLEAPVPTSSVAFDAASSNVTIESNQQVSDTSILVNNSCTNNRSVVYQSTCNTDDNATISIHT